MLVFREGRKVVPGPRLYHDYISRLQQLSPSPEPGEVLDLLLRSGELECALADAASPLTPSIERLTDALADSLVGGMAPRLEFPRDPGHIPEQLTISRPEGFAYYALHPLNYADLAGELAVDAPRIALVGIRSIGTTLSAVVAASARRRGLAATRVTVRPQGHPFDRHLPLEDAQRQWILEQCASGAEFWVVDEGPGLSGSSFLAVGEALLAVGVPLARITLLCSSEPEADKLRAPNAAARWRRFRQIPVSPPWRIPSGAGVSLAGGRWREHFELPLPWPACWRQLERLKFLSGDGRHLFKFAGLGPYGANALERARILHAEGFSPRTEPAGDGFLASECVRGPGLCRQDVSRNVLDRIASYCAWRASAFPAEEQGADLGHMLLINLQEEFGGDFSCPKLVVKRPFVVDGHVHPHEWLLDGDRLLKVDAVDHGDDHFYPGASDIAWDLAGTIVEWDLDADAAAYLVERFTTLTGDDPRRRLSGYVLAYSMFRVGYCRMAAEATRGSDEEVRFLQAAEQYRAAAVAELGQPMAGPDGPWLRASSMAPRTTDSMAAESCGWISATTTRDSRS